MRQRENRIGGILASLIAVPLPPFGAAEGFGIDGDAGQNRSNRPHMLAYDVEQGSARIRDEVPAVGHLDRLRGTL